MMRANRRTQLLRGCALVVVLGVGWPVNAAPAKVGRWKLNANGIWSSPENWEGDVPDGNKNVAIFGNAITGNRAVLLDRAFTVTQISIDDNNSYTLSGSLPNSLTLDAVGNQRAMIVVGSTNGTAKHTISAPLMLGAPVEVQNPTISQLTMSGIISGSSDLQLSGLIAITGNSNYTGATLISGVGTQVTVSSTNGLGSPLAGTTVSEQALLSLGALGNEPLAIMGGTVQILSTVVSTTYSVPLVLGDGGKMKFLKSMNLVSAVELSKGGGTLDGTLTLSGANKFSGDGTLALRGTVQVNRPIGHAGGVTISSASTVSFNVTNTFEGPLTVRGTLNVNASQTVSRLIWDGGPYILKAGKTLTVTDAVDLLASSTIDLTGTTAPVVNKYGSSVTTLSGLGSSYNGPIEVREGTLVISAASALGSAAGPTSVTASTSAVLRINNGLTVDETIFLNNASGIGWGGALTGGEVSSASTPARVNGRVDLGSNGSYLGGGPGTGWLTLAGPITGGSLTKVGNLLRVAGDQNTYTGFTRVREASMVLVDKGRLTTTSNIVIERFGELVLDNRGGAVLGDRLGDAIPIAMNGGILRLWGGAGVKTYETIGDLTLKGGAAGLVVPEMSGETRLIITNLNRQDHATLDVSSGSLGSASKVMFANPPAVRNGILPAWITFDGRLATYGDKGIVPMWVEPMDPNAATPTDNVTGKGVVTLSADRQMNSLSIFSGSAVELSGHELTLNSGALVAHTPLTIRNGTLRAGNGSGGELFVHNQYDMQMDAGIVGNTALTKDGEGNLVLTGTNTYTGTTTINAHGIWIKSASAVPRRNDVDVNGGVYSVEYASTTPLELGTLMLRGGGLVGSSPPIDARTYEVESGSLFARLAGNGTLRKTTDGELILRENNSAYSGTILIEAGTVTLGDAFIYSPYSLGNGVTIVKRGGRLCVRNGEVQAKIVLAGGETLGLGATFNDDVGVTGDSSILAAETTGNQTLVTTIAGRLDVAEGGALAKSGGGGSVSVIGDAHIDGTLNAESGITVVPGSGKKVSGSGKVQGQISIGSHATLAPGNSPGTLTVTDATISAGAVYVWEIARAAGVAGVDWDLLQVDDHLLLTATAGAPLELRLSTLASDLSPGLLADFDSHRSYTWPIAHAGTLIGFSPEVLSIDTSGFANRLEGGSFELISDGSQISLRFTPVPEPGSGCLGLAMMTALLRRRKLRARHAKGS